MAEDTTCKNRSYDAAFKLQVIDYADHNTNRGAARKYGVDERKVRKWKKQKDQLKSANGKRKKLEEGGRKAATMNSVPVEDGSPIFSSVTVSLYDGEQP